jgi:hypothetical protein
MFITVVQIDFYKIAVGRKTINYLDKSRQGRNVIFTVQH